ncbi:Mitochondrial import inner membrane translocase subunit Tim23 [Hondaea fermentalgiana]|uniref:Mitochondrial import inner membrane translocase subunit Tim23 n=1 Tax=Hondaea fermentalgiana TaxID=2315210 RepID=A0A2R5GAN7_9STRA|nr:Mitochondrial import inner membrane translocase subunit Tim23 [Hondaea fermentalgiana]|eukprot:GBG25151.1 Mitochondrial import inner membrane translocase subunit Tim23 [Hondaea fermentalgiana]
MSTLVSVTAESGPSLSVGTMGQSPACLHFTGRTVTCGRSKVKPAKLAAEDASPKYGNQVAKTQRARTKQNKQSTIAFIEQGGRREARDSARLDSTRLDSALRGAARRSGAGAAAPEAEACPREEKAGRTCRGPCELQLDDEQEVGEADEAGEEDQDTNREDNVPLAFGLVIAAGLSTSVGAAFVFCDGVVTRANRFVLAGSLGFSAGVMLYVSLVEIFVKAVDEFVACECLWEHENPLAPARIMTTIVFFLGLLFFLCLDAGIHHIQHLSSLRSAKGDKGDHVESSSTSTSTGIARPTNTWRSGSSPGRTEMASNDDAKDCPSPSPASGGTRENADSELVELAIMDATPPCLEGNPKQVDLELAERHKQMRAAAPPSVRFTSMDEDDSGDVSIEQAARIGLERFGASDEVMAENNPVSVCEHSTQQATEGDAQKRNAESLRRRRRELEELAREHCSHGHGQGQNHGHGHGDRAVAQDEHDEEKLRSMGLMTAIAIGLHNFPEGLATFVATLADPTVGVGLAVAIAVHNIPEGLCVSVPIYYSTGNRVRGFLLATISGFAEIVGAFLGWVALASTFSSEAYASLFALVSGMMVAIVMKELIPTAHRYDPQDRITTVTIFMGMAIMAHGTMTTEERDAGDMYAMGGAEGGAANDYGGYSYQAPNPFANLGAVNPSTLSPMFGAGAQGGVGTGAYKPEYLHYEPKAWHERMCYNSGIAYLGGIGVGGAYGVVNGLMTAPSSKFKIRVNSILNKSGRYGSRFGNALGAVAMMYSCIEAATETMHIEDYVGGDEIVNPVLAATLTGLLYKCTQGPKTMALAGIIGGTAVAGLTTARSFMRGSGRSLLY